MQTSQAVINVLKAAVDEARRKKRGDRGGPLMFIMTSSFGPFLDENNWFGCADRVECGVLVTLAVLAQEWPPPVEVPEEILTLVTTGIPDVREQSRRAPEFVIAYLLGWPCHESNRLESKWAPALTKARTCLSTQISLAVNSCLQWLNSILKEFPPEDSEYWTIQILHLFTASRPELRCQCFLRGLPHEIAIVGIGDLRGNARSRTRACFRRHHLCVWDPLEMPLWDFVVRAVNGFNGSFESLWGGFTSGMLYNLLWHSELRVKLVNVAHRECPFCSKLTKYLSCAACDHQLPDPQHLRVILKRRFILERPGLEPEKAWTCNAPGDQEKEKCGNIYIARHCATPPCREPHDRCPVCNEIHPTGLHRRTRRVYFLEYSFGEVSIDEHVERSLVLVEDHSLQQTITNAAAKALSNLDQHQWTEELILLLEDDFMRWMGLLQSDGIVDWKALWNALKEAPDLPPSPEELKRVYEATIKPHLIEIFKFTFSLADIDWDSINTTPRTQRKEKGK
jgi:hypothetical protein